MVFRVERRRVWLLFWLLLLSPAWAEETSEPDPSPSPLLVFARKVATMSPMVSAPGHGRLSLIYSGSEADARWDLQGRLRSLQGYNRRDQLRYRLQIGLVDDVDMAVVAGQAWSVRDRPDDTQTASGALDLAVQGRWRFYRDPETGLTLGTIGRLTVNSGYLGGGTLLPVGQGFNGWRQSLVFRQELDRFNLGGDVYYSFPLDHSQLRQWSSGGDLALGYQADDWVQPDLELNYQFTDPGQRTTWRATAGSIFQLTPNFYLVTGVQFTFAGLNADRATRFIGHFQFDF